jgi:HPt (histidine-containing phosphotransfer) domain-containing protein
MASDNQTHVLAAALDRLWTQFLPQMQVRVEVLEAVAKAFAAGKLSVDQHEAAQVAAHKLAGVLGTFGLSRGTVVARELELVYANPGEPDPELAERLLSRAAELRTIIASRA